MKLGAAVSALSLLLVMMSGCGASADSSADDGNDNAAGSSESDVVGLGDFGVLESELGLVKDQNTGPNGWSRNDDILAAGPCYKRGQVQNIKWQVRRYKNGAVFFFPKAEARGMGDERAILCVDYDLDQRPATSRRILQLDELLLDSVVRFHLGHPLGWEGAMMHQALHFQNGGHVLGQGIDARCGTINPDAEPRDPLSLATARSLAACRSQGTDENTCIENAYKACLAEAEIDVATRSWLSTPHTSKTYLTSLTVDDQQIGMHIVAIAQRYAERKATNDDVFNMKTDPVGTFAGIQVGSDPTGAQSITHYRYSRLDVHHIYVREFNGGPVGLTTVTITPKSSDSDPIGSALVTCKRLDNEADFDCERPGAPLAR